MNKIKCYIFGHKFRYNFPSLPNKAICVNCKEKKKLNLHALKWHKVKLFPNEKRSDSELCFMWY